MKAERHREKTIYWLTLTISDVELAEHLGCTVEEIEAQDYIGAIRDFGEVTKLQELEA